MSSTITRKITISLPPDLVEFTDRAAQRLEISRSQLISEALREVQQREETRLAEEGYRFYGGEAHEFAHASSHAVAEAIVPYSVGEEADAGEAW